MNDFGFTTEEDTGPDQVVAVLKGIEPLLRNLYDINNKQPIIKWPNRADKIDEFILDLQAIAGLDNYQAYKIFPWSRNYREYED